MYTPHKITLYHQIEDEMTAEVDYNITVLDGVFLDIAQGTNISKSGSITISPMTQFTQKAIKPAKPNGGSSTGVTKTFLIKENERG